MFLDDVDQFIKTTFVEEMKTVQLFSIRDEIKALQSIAKVLTLNTEAFSSTRKTLSECWDSIKDVVKERKKVASEQKSAYKKHRDEFVAELEALKAKVEAKEGSPQDHEHALDDLTGRMRRTSLGKLEIRELRDMVRPIREQLSAHTQTEDARRRDEVMKKDQEKRSKIVALRLELEALATAQHDSAALEIALEPLVKDVAQATLSRIEKQEFEKLIRNVRDHIAEKKEQALLALSDDDRESLTSLKDLLKERKTNRQEIKSQLDSWRKESGSSGLDFAGALQYNDMIQSEKVRLEKVEAAISDIEDKIAKIQGKR